MNEEKLIDIDLTSTCDTFDSFEDALDYFNIVGSLHNISFKKGQVKYKDIRKIQNDQMARLYIFEPLITYHVTSNMTMVVVLKKVLWINL